tara:strand:- start:8070 stop:8270 length:201 start_codon:yes stop_codon:yes gene_type:complete
MGSWCDFGIVVFEESNIKIKLNSIKTDAYQIPVKHPVYSVIDKDKIKRELKNETPSQKDSISKDYE